MHGQRYNATYELSVADRVNEHWTVGLSGDLVDRTLHLLFAASPHPEWGGGMEWRCGTLPCDKETSSTNWCHRIGDRSSGRIRDLTELMKCEPTEEQLCHFRENRQDSQAM